MSIMSVSDIRNLDINPRIIDIILRANLDTFEKILSLSIPELSLLTKLGKRDVSALISAVSEACLTSKIVSAFKLSVDVSSNSYHHDTISTGCKSIDTLLHGGLKTRIVTEITGESSTGKTQLCLQLSLHVQLPKKLGGLSSGAAYICTEHSFPMKRFIQLVNIHKKKNISFKCHNFMDNVFISQIGDLNCLWHCLKQDLPSLLSGRNVKLIVLDSVAALFRCEYTANDWLKRQQDLHNLGSLLHKFSYTYGAAVVCTNQVTSVIENTNHCQSSHLKPALGLYWSSLITNRLMLSRTHHDPDSVCFNSLRTMQVLFSPYLPSEKCNFVVTSDGVKDS